MSYNTFELMPYDKFFGKIYKSFQNEGKELTSEMQNTVEIYDQNYAAADEQQKILAPAPARLAEAVDERVELAPLAPVVPLASLAAKGQVKLERFVQQKQPQQEQVKDLQSKLDSLQARHEQTEAALSRCHETLEHEKNMGRVVPPVSRQFLGFDDNGKSAIDKKNDGGGKRKTKFKKFKKTYNKTSKKYKNKKARY
jgi:hypothetical protein